MYWNKYENQGELLCKYTRYVKNSPLYGLAVKCVFHVFTSWVTLQQWHIPCQMNKSEWLDFHYLVCVCVAFGLCQVDDGVHSLIKNKIQNKDSDVTHGAIFAHDKAS